LTANEIRQHFLERSPWVKDWDKTWDNVICGDGERAAGRLLVTWQSTLASVRKAIDGGFGTLITHEPTYWGYSDSQERQLYFKDNPSDYVVAQEKLDLLAESGLTVLRIHDTWDRFPEYGIPYAWAKFLGFDGKPYLIGNDGYMLCFDVPEHSAETWAYKLAEKTAALGDPLVQFIGEAGRPVRRIGVGTGCLSSPNDYLKLGCDLGVACDDGTLYWGDLACAVDLNYPVVRVNHRTSEEPGMASLAEYLRRELGLDAEYFYEGCTYRLIGRKG
jgi:putative NIF3 family GTP cyclohydrolase 1 type 2